MMTLEVRLPHSKVVVFDIQENSSDEAHKHSDKYQISIPILSNGRLHIERENKLVNPSHRMVTNPDTIHQHEAEKQPLRIMLFDINSDFLNNFVRRELSAGGGLIEFTPWSMHTSAKIVQLGKSAIHHFSKSNTNDDISLHELELEIVSHLLNYHDNSHKSSISKKIRQYKTYSNPNFDRIIECINDELALDLSLETLAEVGKVNKYYLIDLFKNEIGMTPAQYIREMRLKKAENLLRYSKQSITTISYESGFTSLSTFNRVFKQKYGISPTQFRRRI